MCVHVSVHVCVCVCVCAYINYNVSTLSNALWHNFSFQSETVLLKKKIK